MEEKKLTKGEWIWGKREWKVKNLKRRQVGKVIDCEERRENKVGKGGGGEAEEGFVVFCCVEKEENWSEKQNCTKKWDFYSVLFYQSLAKTGLLRLQNM